MEYPYFFIFSDFGVINKWFFNDYVNEKSPTSFALSQPYFPCSKQDAEKHVELNITSKNYDYFPESDLFVLYFLKKLTLIIRG